MIESDMLLYDLGLLLRASKRRSYRKGVIERCKVFVNYLQENNLTTCQLTPVADAVPETFKILRSDLNEDGYQLYVLGYPLWLDAISSGSPIEDTTILDSELAKIRGE